MTANVKIHMAITALVLVLFCAVILRGARQAQEKIRERSVTSSAPSGYAGYEDGRERGNERVEKRPVADRRGVEVSLPVGIERDIDRFQRWILAIPLSALSGLVYSDRLDRWVEIVVAGFKRRNCDRESYLAETRQFLSQLNERISQCE